MRVIFYGTPQLAVPSLEAVHALGEVALVVCQPDRRSGRGMRLKPPPVKERALELGLEVIQPKRVKTARFAETLRAVKADVAVVIAYGRILPRAVLDAPRRGSINVHASILPRLRGAGPIQWAIARGHERAGVCLMQMDEGMDTGPVLVCESTVIGPDETAGELGGRLAQLGANLLTTHLASWVAGELHPVPQDHERATYAPLLTKEDGRVQWSESAATVHNLVRGMHPWPGAFTTLDGVTLKLHKTQLAERTPEAGAPEPGTVLGADRNGILVACGTGALWIKRLQLAGKRRLDAAAFLAGHPLAAGTRLGTP